jgi:hypothetical protein
MLIIDAIVGVVRDLPCVLFHPPLKRIGTRRVHKISIAYDMACPRCGRETVRMHWFPDWRR